MTTPASPRRTSRIAALLLGIGAAVLWAGSRATWLSVEAYDDKSGTVQENLVGATWSTEVTAVTLLLAAACIAGFALRRVGRRAVGVVGALAAVGASWSPLNLLMGEPEGERVRTLLTSGLASQRESDPVALSEWAQVVDVQINYPGPVIAIIGCALALFGGVLLATRPGPDSAKLNKYERKKNREARIVDDLQSTPDSGRVMWDALDADIDPTDDLPGAGKGEDPGAGTSTR
ncbi:TIGR02234 family membrane protein [Corynebacterium halotolerans]|uniref:TIGR02234 family membrane protein n=1 Tax=Corynebacterium halotolerans TaxID=225326 RepID=UPI003CF1AF7E